MKKILLKIFLKLRFPIDVVFSYIIILPAYLMMVFRRIGGVRLPRTSRRLKQIGVYPIRDHYYEPLFNEARLRNPLDKERPLPGVNINLEGQLKFLERLKASDELLSLELGSPVRNSSGFSLGNGTFEAGDADFLYQIIRFLKPRKIVEIGSGNSTKIARLALERNQRELGQECTHICIEPFEEPWLEQFSGIKLIRGTVETVRFDWAAELDEGDLLFVDSSHMIRPQGDVLFEYLEVFPRLKKGVYVHIHDIFTPRDYLRRWIVDGVSFWNEQYLLEALLSSTNRYEVVAALNYLKWERFDDLRKVCPYLTAESEPGSFYFRVV